MAMHAVSRRLKRLLLAWQPEQVLLAPLLWRGPAKAGMFFRRVAELTWLFSLLRGTKWASQIRVGKIVFPTSRAFWNDSMGIMVPDGLEDAMYPPASRTKEQVDLYTKFTKFFYREELGGMGGTGARSRRSAFKRLNASNAVSALVTAF